MGSSFDLFEAFRDINCIEEAELQGSVPYSPVNDAGKSEMEIAADVSEVLNTTFAPIQPAPFRENWETVVRALYDRILDGFTVQLVTGKEPTDGYIVSPHPECTQIIEVSRIIPDDLLRYCRKYRDLLAAEEKYFGAWCKENKVYLDVCEKVLTPERARKLCLAHDQQAYYDLGNMADVFVTPDTVAAQEPVA